MHQVEIRIKGQIDEERSDWFEGLNITPGGPGETIVNGRVIDQTALHGLLAKIRDLGLVLISIHVTDETTITPAEKA